jgi:hypothetical protein
MGDGEAPPIQSSDEDNIRWCAEKAAVLVTNDRGKKDRTIGNHLASHHDHVIFDHDDLRSGDPHLVLLAVLLAENDIDLHVNRPRGGCSDIG